MNQQSEQPPQQWKEEVQAHNTFWLNADVWTQEHGWTMKIDRFKQLNSLPSNKK